MPKTIVMCPPQYFDVEYELSTNRWMDKNIRPDKELAQTQWQVLHAACLRAGMKTLQMRPEEGLPDLTFAANAGLPWKNKFVLSQFFHPERQREIKSNAKFFGRVYGKENVIILPENAFFEGQGDAVWLNERQLLIGYGIRTNPAAIFAVTNFLRSCDPEVEVIALPMHKQSTFYHLDTCLLYLPKPKAFFVYPLAFSPMAIDRLNKLGLVMTVDKMEAENFICNSVVINDETIFMPWVDSVTRRVLENFGYTDIQVFPMSEFMKSGGAVKCLILEL